MAVTIAKASTIKLKAVALEETTEHGLSAAPSNAFRAVEFIEESPRPTDAYYFPLATDTLGIAPGESIPSIPAAIASNLAYDEDGVWVGSQVANIWPVLTGQQGWTGGTVASSERAFAGTLKQALTKPGGSTVIHNTLASANSFAPSQATRYTLSAYYRQVSGTLTTPTQFSLAKSIGGTPLVVTDERYRIPSIKEQWQRGVGTVTVNETVAAAWPHISWTAATAMEARFCGMMLEAKPFVSAYCETTRNAGTLAFNLHDTLGLNWDEDYTITYWKKVHGTASDREGDGYNVDSLGRNSNTVGGGYLWWGKFGPTFTWGTADNNKVTTQNDLQYKWLFIVLRRSGTTLTIRTYGIGADPLFSSIDIDNSDATPDRYVTQNGYDLQLGGYDTGSPGNAYFKDLIVLKRALSNTELDLLYATKLKVYTDSIMVGTLEEGVL